MVDDQVGAVSGAADRGFDVADDFIEDVGSHWGLVMLAGFSALVLGIVAVSWPGQTATVLAIIFGIDLLIFGIFKFVSAFTRDEGRWLAAFAGIFGIVIGLLIMRRPLRALAFLIIFLGFYWLFSGLVDVFSALANSDQDHRGLKGLLGVVAIIAGIVVLIWPSESLLALAWVMGIFLIVRGIMMIVLSLRIRKFHHEVQPA